MTWTLVDDGGALMRRMLHDMHNVVFLIVLLKNVFRIREIVGSILAVCNTHVVL